MFSFNDNHKSISEISTMFDNGTLIVDDTYQRRSVWGEKDNIRLIETILLNLVIPELFFWKAETDPETGEGITHIVDGQQRIKAITGFITNQVKLKPNYLLDDESKAKFANKLFKDLEPEIKQSFWNYRLMIIEIDPKASKEDIKKMFRRLNLTDYNLNDQEKRNSMSGEFAALCRELSDLPIWDEYRLFNVKDVKRMKDVEFCGSLILLYKRGIIDQTDQSALNQAYEDMQSGYDDANNDRDAVIKATEEIKKFFINDEVEKFLRRKAQLFTVFSIVFYALREDIEITDEVTKRLSEFVGLYAVFSNQVDLSAELSDGEKPIYDLLKRYKLASSEGLNKHTNRMIRFNCLKDFFFKLDQTKQDAQRSLLEKMTALGVEEADELDEEDL